MGKAFGVVQCAVYEKIFLFFLAVLKFFDQTSTVVRKDKERSRVLRTILSKSEKVQFGGKSRQNSEGEGRQRKTLFCSHLLTLQC